jgi:hypothetical protein
MLAGAAYQDKINAPGGRLKGFLASGKSNADIIRDIYVAAYARVPDAAEIGDLEQAIGAAENRERALGDFLWAVLSSREFAENH